MEYTLEKVASFESLMRAHYRARVSKQHKKDIVEFEMNIAYNLSKLEDDLLSGNYKLRGYKRFMIYDPKEREIQALHYYDRVVQNSLCYNFLVPCYTKKLIYDNGACRKGKGTHFTRSRIEGFIHKFYKKHGRNGYFLKLDIKKYFNNIDHDILKQKLGKVKDQRLNKLLEHIIDSYEHSPNKGVPMGNQSSQIFALLYLNDIDRIIKEKYKIKYYVRYMDDLLILHEDKNLLRKLFEELKLKIVEHKLQFNKKSEIIALKNGIEFLGVKYNLLENGRLLKRMKRQSKDRMIKRIHQIQLQYKCHVIDKEQIIMSLAGFKGNIKRMNVNGIINKYLFELKCLVKNKKYMNMSS
ncbi:MAG: hypothetical protein E7376_04610 [Clostridiales bacterium]|nr:hypothetical protein [Clostridiales bacterium]